MARLKNNNTESSGMVLMPMINTKMEEDEQRLEKKETIYSLRQKYKNSVLYEIYEDEGILHSVLANRHTVSASGLNAIVKRLNEVISPPIKISKQGKFTLYSLEETGKTYVQEEILPSLAFGATDEYRIHNIYKLLCSFKDQNPKGWVDILKNILTEEDGEEEFEEGYGFIKEISNYYLASRECAVNFLNLTIVDRDLQKKIIDYIAREKKFDTAWDVLNYWEKEDTLEVYRLIDSLFSAIETRGNMPDYNDFSLMDGVYHMERVLDKIQASLLQVLFQGLPKEEAISFWLAFGVEKHLAIYLAEKYITCSLCYKQAQNGKEKLYMTS